jgi:hypothetical protein
VGSHYVDVNPSSVTFTDCRSCIVVTHEGISFGEEPRARLQLLAGTSMTFSSCTFPDGIRIPDGSHIVLTNCMVHGGVVLNGKARLEMVGGVVRGTNQRPT